ncbi:MAG: nucleotidyl transferase AbiEii/AbiGii toxin family protein [Candidatus Rokuibacteriota bacterium]
MRYSREYLGERSAGTGFRPDTLEKVLRLLRLLDQVTRHPFLGSRLLLKGGTALNLFYAAAPRLSVDLDFNYVVDLDQMLRERPEVERAISLARLRTHPALLWKVGNARRRPRP